MNKLEEKIEKFKELDKKNKIKKLKSMLEIIKGNGDLFDDINNLLEGLGNDISEELLISIYSTIQSAIENLNSASLKEDISKLDKIRNKLKKLKDLEEKERDNENPEDLLNNL